MAASLCILQEGVCVSPGARKVHNNKHRCHSNTDEGPSYFLALAGSIRVHTRLLDVSTAVVGSSYVNREGHEHSVLLVWRFIGGTYTTTVRALVLLALASFPAHSY